MLPVVDSFGLSWNHPPLLQEPSWREYFSISGDPCKKRVCWEKESHLSLLACHKLLALSAVPIEIKVELPCDCPLPWGETARKFQKGLAFAPRLRRPHGGGPLLLLGLRYPQNPKVKAVPFDVDFSSGSVSRSGRDRLATSLPPYSFLNYSWRSLHHLGGSIDANLTRDKWNKAIISGAFCEHLDGYWHYRKKGNEERDFYLPKVDWTMDLARQLSILLQPYIFNSVIVLARPIITKHKISHFSIINSSVRPIFLLVIETD